MGLLKRIAGAASWSALIACLGAPPVQAARDYFPSPESAGGWRRAEPSSLGVDVAALEAARAFHNEHAHFTRNYGGALLIVYKGRVIAEDYVTGSAGGPQPWTAQTCNDIKSSTKSVFGTVAGVFLDEFKDRVTPDTPLIGTSRGSSLIPQIWDQPLTDERKKAIKVKHVLSMTSGHASQEPWNAPAARQRTPGYSGAFQMLEYCFGWWSFEKIPSQTRLLFVPGTGWNYSNFGLELLALAMKNVSGQPLGAYACDRVLGPIGLPRDVRDHRYTDIPYENQNLMNFSTQPGWGMGGGEGCDAYGGDRSASPYGTNTIAGSTLRISARDFARLAYLWLRRGRWEDRQLVPEAWMQVAAQRYRRENGATPKEYGYTFWVMDSWDGVPRDAFMSRGSDLNDAYVVPSLDLVVVRQGNENRGERDVFRHTLLQKIVAAIPSHARLDATPGGAARQAVVSYLESLARPDGGFGWSDQPDSHLTTTFGVIGSYRALGLEPLRRDGLVHFVRTRHPLREPNAEARQYAARLRGFSFQQIQSLVWLGESAAEFSTEVRGWSKPSTYGPAYERNGNPLFAEEMLAFICRPLLGLPVNDLAAMTGFLSSRRRANGSFNNTPAADGGDGNVLNTWAGVQAMQTLGRVDEKRLETIAWLRGCQMGNGGFTHQPNADVGARDDVAYTWAGVRALALLGAEPRDRAGCIRYLRSLWSVDGGFGPRPGLPSDPMATYHALETLAALRALSEIGAPPEQRLPAAPALPWPAGFRPFTIQIEAPGQGSPAGAVDLAEALRIHLWGAKNADPRWIARAQQIADERKVPVRFFVSNEEYGGFMGLRGHGAYSHLSDPIAPAGADFGAPMTGRDAPWTEFRDQRIGALQRAGGRMIWQICDNEPFARILLDDSIERGVGYRAISTFHFWTRNMAYALPYVLRYRHELPFVALQDAHGSEPWWWTDNLTGYRTVFLGSDPGWEAFLKAMDERWVVAIRRDAVTQFRTRMLGGGPGVQEFLRQHEGEWKWWDESTADLRRPVVALGVVTPSDEFESARPANGIILRVRCWRRTTPLGLPTDPVVELENLTVDGNALSPEFVEVRNDKGAVTDCYHQVALTSLVRGSHTATATVRRIKTGARSTSDIRFTVP